MKKRGFWFGVVLLTALLVYGIASAATSPVVASIELDPAYLAAPGKVKVSITVSNTSNEDLKDPVTLLDPAAQVVPDFGNSGQAMLKAGGSLTWTGEYDVSQSALDNGSIVYYLKYTNYLASGEAVEQSIPIQGKITTQKADVLLQVKRTITPTVAQQDQDVKVTYFITNAGTVTLNDIKIQENTDIQKKKQSIDAFSLKSGQTAELTFTVKMGKKDLTSGAKLTYTAEGSSKKLTYTVDNQKITYGDPKLTASLSSSAKGAVVNNTVTLTLQLSNKGNVDFSDIRVTDATLGEVFSNQELKAGDTLNLTKDITIQETAQYQFNVTAMDATGNEVTASTDAVAVTAMNADDVLNLSLSASVDQTEVYGNPANVHFTLVLQNDSNVDAKNVKVSHGDTELATFDSIPKGESRTINRDAALSYSGKYQFTVTANDPLDNALTFQSNEMQIAVYAPTPAPATPTPPPVPTAEPSFVPATVIPIRDPSIGAVPKAIQNVLLPLLILAGVVLVAVCVLLLIATKRRADQKRASDAAYDHLERAKRRDYITPADDEEEKEQAETDGADKEELKPAKKVKPARRISPEEQEAQMANRRVVGEPRDEEVSWELPHMKYAREAVDTMSAETQDDHLQTQHDLYDDDSEDLYQGFERPDSDETSGWQTDDSYEDEAASGDETYAEDEPYSYDEDAPYEEDGGVYEDVPEEAEEWSDADEGFDEAAEEHADAEPGDAHEGRRRSRRHQE